ncbi:MAG: DegT/DnrJ/EryC1/StrS family aminotransferase [candidate division Zixibacteria bacterium]|nr:DegT/DnrJ/EryC1/StrS family aminotransferase [candidate division Zixibacteria bacterium]
MAESLMFRLLSPAGTPVNYSDLWKAINLRLGQTDIEKMLVEKLQHISGAKYYYFVNSGRTGLTLILRALSQMSDPVKTEVVIPAYTCFSVPAAIIRAGLKIRLIDVDPVTLDYNYNQLLTLSMENVLCIIGCNLFGIPSNWKELKSVAESNDTFLIDDAAQAMGSQLGEKALGLQGDIGFYSLGRGKNMTTYSGGIIVTDREDIAEYLTNLMHTIPRPGLVGEVVCGIKLFIYSNFLHPHCYWLPSMIPFLGLGETVFDESFEIEALSKFQMAMATVLIDYLSEYNNVRFANSKQLSERLTESDRFTIPGHTKDKFPVYLRFPLLCKNRSTRDQAVATLKRKGIIASKMYPSTIANIHGIESHLMNDNLSFPGAQQVVDTLIALPTHPYISETDIIKMTSTLTDL